MSHAKSARRLGIGHETLFLAHDKDANLWLNPKDSHWGRVESAALGHYRNQGWFGYAGEGGLVLNLIKAMSFKKIPLRHRSTFVEAVYAQNVAFEEDRYETPDLLDNIRSSTANQVRTNFETMTSRVAHSVSIGGLSYVSESSMLDYFPGLRLQHFLGLLDALGNDGVLRIATLFAHEPYEYRKGWPDLTLWRGRQVAFREIKAPGDRLSRSQRKLIQEVLKPLAHDVAVVDVCREQGHRDP